jgi:transposase InsO family protein
VLDWVAACGIPLLLLTGSGTQVVSMFFQTVCRLLRVKQLLTTAFHPSTDGKVNRFKQSVVKRVMLFVSKHHDERDEIAGVSMYAYITTIQSTTGFAPFELILTRDPCPGILQPKIVFGCDPPLSSRADFRQNFLRRVESLGKAVSKYQYRPLKWLFRVFTSISTAAGLVLIFGSMTIYLAIGQKSVAHRDMLI